MSALAEALLAAQRQAVGLLAKAYVVGAVTQEHFLEALDAIGLRDGVEQGLLLASLETVKQLGGEAPKAAGATAPKMPEQPSDAQQKLIAKLCKEKNHVEPDWIASKEQASEIITALQNGSYNPAAYSVPF
jgi:hypothetical protein